MIHRRRFLFTIAGGAAGALAAPLWGWSPFREQRPSIIYVSADDLGYGDLSVYGRPDYTTPVLDRLATEGVRLVQAYAIAPVCTPSRVGFMTGRYPARLPVGLREPLTTSGRDRAVGLPTTQATVSSQLRAAGYRTGHFGKWHLGLRREFGPDRHGFEESFGFLSGAVDYVDHHNAAGEHDLYHGGREIHEAGYLTDLVTDRAVAFVREARSPFFACVQYNAPHWPWQRRTDPAYPPERLLGDDGPPEIFPDMVRVMDEGIGRILEALSAAGVADRTLVIFTSDNGGERFSNMGGLRGHKMELWEGGIRVPAIVRWPGVIPAGGVSRQVATTLDWTATILSLAGVSVGEDAPLDGADVLPILAGRLPERDRTVFWRIQRTRHRAVRSGRWKYLATPEGEFLFDLEDDPAERTDLQVSHPDVLESLKAKYAAWELEMLPPIPL